MSKSAHLTNKGSIGMAFLQTNSIASGHWASAGMAAMRLSASVLCAFVLCAAVALAQDLPGDGEADDTPDLVPQREGLKIEPYTGPPIFLPDPPQSIAAKELGTKLHKEYFDREEKKHLRIERSIVTYSDDSIKNHGIYREFYKNGQVFVEGQYVRGEPSGDWKYFHENGTEAKTISYENGRPNGPIESRREDGTIRSQREYAGGKRSGTWKTYDESGENALTESHYAEGKPDGLWQQWYANGTKLQQTPYVNGLIQGTMIRWNDEGFKQAEAEFEKGARHGKTNLWSPDGRHIEQEYEKGKLVVSKVLSE